MRPTHRPSRVWIHADLRSWGGFIRDGDVPLWRHAIDVAMCWLHDLIVSPPVRWSQQVQEKRDWQRWCKAAEGQTDNSQEGKGE